MMGRPPSSSKLWKGKKKAMINKSGYPEFDATARRSLAESASLTDLGTHPLINVSSSLTSTRQLETALE